MLHCFLAASEVKNLFRIGWEVYTTVQSRLYFKYRPQKSKLFPQVSQPVRAAALTDSDNRKRFSQIPARFLSSPLKIINTPQNAPYALSVGFINANAARLENSRRI
jgi:hypothetical protein